MERIKSSQINMLEVLIENASSGKKIHLNSKPVREIVKIERNGLFVDTVILAMGYSGTVDEASFRFSKKYSFLEDEPQDALDCLLIANNRLQVDYERLKEAGITIKEEYFTFQNAFTGISPDVFVRTPALRLQHFIDLARAGLSVSVHVILERPVVILRQEGADRKGFGCIASFVFTTGKDKTTLKKLYGLGGYDDAKSDREDVVHVANKRLERDCQRLRSAGMDVGKYSFPYIWERVFER